MSLLVLGNAVVLSIIGNVGTVAAVQQLELGIFIEHFDVAFLLTLSFLSYQLNGSFECKVHWVFVLRDGNILLIVENIRAKATCTDGNRCSLILAYLAEKLEELDSLVECDGLNTLVGRQLCEERLFLIFGRSNLCHWSETSYLDEYRASALWVDSQ